MTKTFLILGFLASFILYIGDMLLYFSTEDYDKNKKYESVYKIMEKLPNNRITIGALTGILSAFLGSLGAFHIYTLSNNNSYNINIISSLLMMFSFIIGGIYHTHWFYYKLANQFKKCNTLKEVENYINILKKITFISFFISNMLVIILIILQFVNIPIYFIIVNPIILFLLIPILKKLPQPYYLLIVGGWGNLPFVIYYLALILFL